MRYFYRFLLFFTRFDLAIARSTGRDTRNIAQLSQEELAYEQALWVLEH